MKLSNLILLIVVMFAIGCQKSEKPEEIVRIVPGKSLMEQVAPALKRQQQGKTKIYLVHDSVTAEQFDKHLKEDAKNAPTSKYQTLYISGQKAKNKKIQQELIKKQLENAKTRK